ncbi:MAG: Gldg family protein, partial [bacterium]
VAVSGDRQAALPMIDPRTEELLEYSVTRMIHRVTLARKPVLGILSSLPVMGSTPPPFAMPGQPRPQPEPAWAAFRDLSQDYDVRTLPATTERIDGDVEAVVVVHPKDLPDTTLFALDQFVLRGGRLLAFVDPFCVADSGGNDGGQFGMPSRSSNLAKLFEAWGVQYEPGKVVADLEAMTPLRGRNNTVENSPLYLSLRKPNFAEGDVLTAPLNSLMLVMAGSFGAQAAEGIKVTPLITSSEKSCLTDTMMLQFDPNAFRRQFKSGQASLNLAIRLQGRFKSAFPNGKPRPVGDTNTVSSAADSESTMKESKGDGNVILVADADVLYNDFCGQELNFLGYKAFQPFNDNLTLFANMVEQMAGSADLIGLRSRGRTQRPFTRVLALQAAAQEQWMEQEKNLEQKLQTTQRRMDELQRQKDDRQRFVLSPEQQREVAVFRKEAANCRQELKQVRRNLREGIEALGMKIKLINILLVPALVAVSGIGFFVIRRRKTER